MSIVSPEEKKELIERLARESCSCLISNGRTVYVGRERGVRDLFCLFETEPEVLRGAFVADKVVGKGAAALMGAGGVAEVYAAVISRPALRLLTESDVAVSFGTLAENIINRAGTDICPVEKLCADCRTAAECLPLIKRFINEQIQNQKL